ncbi:MAG: hypothetical protein WA637_08165 [Terriglobales bacterium]
MSARAILLKRLVRRLASRNRRFFGLARVVFLVSGLLCRVMLLLELFVLLEGFIAGLPQLPRFGTHRD